MDNKDEVIRQKQQEIYNLKADLSSPVSPIGDWKIVKIYEERLKSEPDPYDFAELNEKRQEVLDRIAEIEAELGIAEQTEDNTLNALSTGYDRAKQELVSAYVEAVMLGNTEMQDSLKEEIIALNEQFDADYAEAEKGE